MVVDADLALTHLGRYSRWQMTMYVLIVTTRIIPPTWSAIVIIFQGEYTPSGRNEVRY